MGIFSSRLIPFSPSVIVPLTMNIVSCTIRMMDMVHIADRTSMEAWFDPTTTEYKNMVYPVASLWIDNLSRILFHAYSMVMPSV